MGKKCISSSSISSSTFCEEVPGDRFHLFDPVMNRISTLHRTLIISIQHIVGFFKIAPLVSIQFLQMRQGVGELLARRLLVVARFQQDCPVERAGSFSHTFE